MNEVVRIGKPSFEKGPRTLCVRFPVEGLQEDELWFTVDEAHADFVAESCDAALVGLLVAAMAARRPIVVDGAVSARLLWGLRNTVQPVVARQLPFVRAVTVEADANDAWPGRNGGATLTGLSCGVDSFAVLVDHLLAPDLPERFRVTHGLFSHVGHHGYGGDLEGRVERRRTLARQAADQLGIPLIHVTSNLPAFYPDRDDSPLAWAAALTVRNASVPLLLQGGVSRFLFASSDEWNEVGVAPTAFMTDADPILLPALETERIALHAVGLEYSRVEKTRRISALPLAQRTLDVCMIEGGTNCSACEKCLRTMLTLELLGALSDFESRFDRATYGRHRTEFIARMLVEREDAYHIEIRELMREVGFDPPWAARAIASAIRVWRLVPHALRKRLRGMPEPPPPPVAPSP